MKVRWLKTQERPNSVLIWRPIHLSAGAARPRIIINIIKGVILLMMLRLLALKSRLIFWNDDFSSNHLSGCNKILRAQ